MKIDGIWYNIVNGQVVGNTIAKNRNTNTWWVIDEYGNVDFTYTGFADNASGTYYVENGKVDFSMTGLVEADVARSQTASKDYEDEVRLGYVVKGKLTPGPSIQKDDWGYYYVAENGFVDFDVFTAAKNSAGWWAIESSCVNFDRTGFVERADNGTIWYVVNGKVNFNATGVYKDTWTDEWGYVKNGRLQTGKTDVQKNSSGWWYIDKDGYVDFTANTVAKNSAGWWAIENGKVNFNRTGFVERADNGTIWYVEKGKVNFKANGIYKDTKTGKWGYVNGGQLQTGRVDVQKNSAGWWYIDEDGYVNFYFMGIAANDWGEWYLENGKVDFTYNGTYIDEDTLNVYGIVNGCVTWMKEWSTSTNR